MIFSLQDLREVFLRDNVNQVQGSFVYVVHDGNGCRKVGVTTDPIQRLAALQTGNSRRLEFEYVAVTPSNGYGIEARVKAMLAPQRAGGEWFHAGLEEIVSAINSAASIEGQPIQGVPVDYVPSIVQLVRSGSNLINVPLPFYYRKPVAFTLAWAAVFAVLFFVLLFTVI